MAIPTAPMLLGPCCPGASSGDPLLVPSAGPKLLPAAANAVPFPVSSGVGCAVSDEGFSGGCGVGSGEGSGVGFDVGP